MSLAKVSYYAFDVATVTLFIGFILLVVHTTLLAAGRKQVLVGAGARLEGRTPVRYAWLKSEPRARTIEHEAVTGRPRSTFEAGVRLSAAGVDLQGRR